MSAGEWAEVELGRWWWPPWPRSPSLSSIRLSVFTWTQRGSSQIISLRRPLTASGAKLTKLMAGEELGLLRLRFSGCCPPLCPFSCGGLSPSLGLLLGGESRPEEPFLLSMLEQAPTESPDLRRGRACLRRGC